MTPRNDRPRSRPRRGLHRTLVALLATVLLAGLTTVLTPTPAHAVSRWAGYSIKAGRTADDKLDRGLQGSTRPGCTSTSRTPCATPRATAPGSPSSAGG
ncbi:hypothetical protein G5V59_27355 [Nocardioides sp. W3-2-3]|uniref:hypothetical protein n=1 Tax=Nocardioides convexus TaxID=2712224 RepID=UPI0024188E16|nr:hypothetical protein [Nocardioides convexus]NHA02100.1 hypothetical protein [Nocardioides convexus]